MKILVTGASSGMGFDAARALAQKGFEVYGAARRVALMDPLKEYGVIPLQLDVTSEESIVSLEEGRRQMEVNLFGLAAITKKVLPGMRERGRGRIINISSVAGKAVLYFGGWYHVSKYAVEAFSDALRIEMKPFGVDVVLIEPGATNTSWGVIAADHLSESSMGTPYEQPALAEAAMMRKVFSRRLFSEPAVVTRAICRAVRARRPRARYVVAAGSFTMVFWHAVLPTRWWDALVRLLGSPRVARIVEKL